MNAFMLSALTKLNMLPLQNNTNVSYNHRGVSLIDGSRGVAVDFVRSKNTKLIRIVSTLANPVDVQEVVDSDCLTLRR